MENSKDTNLHTVSVNQKEDIVIKKKGRDIPETYCIALPELRDFSEKTIRETVAQLSVKPDNIYHFGNPYFEITKVDDYTADVKLIHGFRAQFKKKENKFYQVEHRDHGETEMYNDDKEKIDKNYDHCLIPKIDYKTKDRLLSRGSFSYSDLSNFALPDRVEEEEGVESQGSSKGLLPQRECPWELDPQKIKLGQRIAVGGFAEVFVATYEGTKVAVKRLFDRDTNTFKKFRDEVSILVKLRHPNLILFMGYCFTPELCIISEYMSKGCLFGLLREGKNQPLEKSLAIRVMISVAQGMNYLHTRSPPILHLDLKSPNILVDGNWQVKLTDFGLSKFRSHTMISASVSSGGTPHWMAPEVIRSEQIDEKADVFSFSIVLWEILTGGVPWENFNFMQVLAAVGFKGRRLSIPENADPFVVNLMKRCWQEDPRERPSFEEILKDLEMNFIYPRFHSYDNSLNCSAIMNNDQVTNIKKSIRNNNSSIKSHQKEAIFSRKTPALHTSTAFGSDLIGHESLEKEVKAVEHKIVYKPEAAAPSPFAAFAQLPFEDTYDNSKKISDNEREDKAEKSKTNENVLLNNDHFVVDQEESTRTSVYNSKNKCGSKEEDELFSAYIINEDFRIGIGNSAELMSQEPYARMEERAVGQIEEEEDYEETEDDERESTFSDDKNIDDFEGCQWKISIGEMSDDLEMAYDTDSPKGYASLTSGNLDFAYIGDKVITAGDHWERGFDLDTIFLKEKEMCVEASKTNWQDNKNMSIPPLTFVRRFDSLADPDLKVQGYSSNQNSLSRN